MSLTIGIDPGKSGALACVDSYGALVEVEDMPIIGDNKRVSVELLTDILAGYAVDDLTNVVIEDVFSMSGWGHSMAFNFGRSKGICEGVAAGLQLPIKYVTPAKWKRDMKLARDKGEARSLAVREWPEQAGWFKRVKDDGRAEAALIALWWVRHGQA